MLWACLLVSCTGGAAQVPSEWPPPDFRLVVEDLGESGAGVVVTRRFSVGADGVCTYGRSPQPLVDPVTRTAVPVFSTLCAYRLRDECTRLLARKVHRRGVLDLEPVQGDQNDTRGVSLRLYWRAFGNERTVVASGQIHGSLVRVLHVVNAYLPPDEAFSLAGMAGDPEPTNLTGVPEPVEGVVGALAWHEERLGERPEDADLMLDTFALACTAGERAKADRLLHRWSTLVSVRATSAAPFTDPPRLLPEMLQRMLPP
jgi:hypothetical protein